MVIIIKDARRVVMKGCISEKIEWLQGCSGG